MLIGPILSKREIKSLCGSTSYSRGESYFRARRVQRLSYDPNEWCYEAVVKGSKSYRVSVVIDDHTGDVEAECDCPAFDSYYQYCKHIAAVLLQIEDLSRHAGSGPPAPKPPAQVLSYRKLLEDAESLSGKVPAKPMPPLISERDKQIALDVLTLFERPNNGSISSVDGINEPAQVSVDYTIRIDTGYWERVQIEMKVGVERLYVVQKIKDFLDKLDKRTPVVFTKKFTFDPCIHSFSDQDAGIIKLLLNSYRNERDYREMTNNYSGYGNDRALMITPSTWEDLLPLLSKATVRLETGGKSVSEIDVREGGVPLRFQLGQGPVLNAYKLELNGLSELKLSQKYGIAISPDGILYRMDRPTVAQFLKLQTLMTRTGGDKITIPPDHIDSFMQRVVPELKRIGEFRVDKNVADRVVSEPLKVDVFLDRSDEGLHAKVEYVYGDVRINPLLSNIPSGQTAEQIIMRDPGRENAVLDILHQSSFRQQGDRFNLDADELVYDFLYGGLERLRQAAEVYITQAVHVLRSSDPVKPRTEVNLDSGTNWLEVRFELEGVEKKELVQLLRSLTEKKKYHRLSSGMFISLEEESFREIGQLFEELGIRKAELKGDRVKLPAVRGLSLSEYSGKGSSGNVKLGKPLRRLLDNLNNPDNLDFEPPQTLAPVLRDYQVYGFHWMKTLGFYGFGGILADDMGLGKTLQSIAFIVSEREQRDFSGMPVLIVCPASLVYNWRNEFIKFAPQLNVLVAAGGKAERDAVLEQAAAADILITSYPLLRRDVEWYAERHFHTVILDEAQAIKNSATQTAQSIKMITADRRFALTGTPVENRLEELWSIYDAVFPDLFSGRKTFNELTPEQIARKVRPFLLRRMKKDVLTELPEKIETLQTSELLEEQKKLYMGYLMRLQDETLQQLQSEGYQKSRMKILAGLTRLRQICCHPSLFLESYNGMSGKLEQLLEMLEEFIREGRRMLVFSQFTGMLVIIREEFERRGWSYFYLDGTTKSNERVEMCSRFNEGGDTKLFLISLKAGGTGLNLTGADTVILYDLWWNPAVEQQAADRAHRMGQKNIVQVIRLMTEGTIEEKMYELQQRKKDLIDMVVQPDEEALSSLTEADIRELLSI